MWDFSVGRTFSLVFQTWPFLLLRLAVFAGVALLFFVVTGVGTFSGYAIGSGLYDVGTGYQYGVFGTLGGFGLASLIFRFLRSYILYMVKAAHIAVLAAFIDGKSLPDGRGQINYGRHMVTKRFIEANVLFALDQLIKVILKALGKFLSGIAGFIPIPGLQGIVNFIRAVAENAVTFVDEIILAENMRRSDENPWEVSRQALILYAQNGKTMLKNALWLTIFLALLTLLVFAVLVGPFVASFAVLPQTNMAYGIIAAGVAAVFVKEVLFEPLAVTALMQVYSNVTAGQKPDPEWDRKLMEMSESFRELTGKALAGSRSSSVNNDAKNPWS